MPTEVPSPCVDVCAMDADGTWCHGCLRTIDEIAAWSQLDDEGKRAVWALIDARRLERQSTRNEDRAMKRIVFHFDPISPFAYLAFERAPQVLAGCSYEVDYRPVLFAGLLQHWGTKGPAEIEPKRAWTFRHVAWLARRHGIEMQMPAVHPFNPLPLLRMALACGPNRRVVEALFRHVWVGGADPTDPVRLAALTAVLAPARDPAGDEVKRELRAATEAAIAAGIFGVPSFELDGRVFWGVDALEMLRDALQGGAWFDGPAWAAAAVAPPGVVR